MKILVANIGSTSLKYRLFDFSNVGDELVTRGGFERVTDYSSAIDDCLGELREGGYLQDASELAAVGFKTVVADGVSGCVALDDATLDRMEALNALAPAHNPPYIEGVRVFRSKMPNVPLIGLFETAFYQWIPETAKRYAVPQSWFENGVRRWGFHGASHKFVAERCARLLGREDVARATEELYVRGPESGLDGPPLRMISLHLGGSSSITGSRNGVAIGNSMGLSPQSGLPHNNRVGDLDSFAIPMVMRRMGLSLEEVESALCKESGLLGISGVSNDLRDIGAAAESGNASAQLALDYLKDQCRHWIGAYYAALNGLDALIFTAGIGENRAETRATICDALDALGIRLDSAKNDLCHGEEMLISAEDSKVAVWVIPTNEEWVVARETKRFIETR